MAMKDEAAAGGSSSQHNRVLFFEIVAGTKLLLKSKDAAIGIFKGIGDSWNETMTGMNRETQTQLENIITKMAEVEDKQKAGMAELEAANKAMVDEATVQANKKAEAEIAAAQRSRDKQLAMIEEIRQAVKLSGNVQANEGITGLANLGAGIAAGATGEAYAAEEAAAKEKAAVVIQANEQEAAAVVAAQETENKAVMANLAAQKVEVEANISNWNRVGGALSGVGRAFTGLAMSAGILGGVMAVLFGVLKSTADAVSAWATEIVQASEATGLSYRNVQVYLEAVEQFGVSHTIAETILARFNKRLQENAGLFASLGITARDPNVALQQFMDVLSKTADKMAYFNTVMGGTVRSGSANALVDVFVKLASSSDYVVRSIDTQNNTLLHTGQVLTGAAAGMERFGVLMDNTGMMLSDATVKAGALSGAIENQLSQAFEGLKMKIGQAILPNFQAMELVLIGLISGTNGAGKSISGLSNIFEDLAKWIGNALGYLIGFIGGIMGMKEADLAAIFNQAAAASGPLAAGTVDAAQATESLKNEVTGLQQQLKNLTDATKLQDEALSNQITTLQRNQKAFDDAHDDKIKAMQNEKQNYDDQLKLQDDLHQSYLVQLQDELNALQDTQNSRRQSGEDLASYQTRLAEQSLQKTITTEQNRRQTVDDTYQQQIDMAQQASDAAKEAYDNQTAALVQNLQDQKTALQDNLSQQTDILNKKIQDDQNILNGASADTTKTIELSAAQIADAIHTSLQAMETQATTSGLKAGANFTGNFTGAISSALSGMVGDMASVGQQLGAAIVSGMTGAVMQGLVQGSGLSFLVSQFLTGDSTKIELAAVKAISQATTTGQVYQIAGAAIHSNLLNDEQRNTVNAAAQGMIQSLNNASKLGSAVAGLGGLPVHGDGGVFGSPHLAWVGDKPEAIVPLNNPSRASEVMQQAGLGGHTFNAIFNGPVATGAVAGTVMTKMAIEAQRQGLMYGAGVS